MSAEPPLRRARPAGFQKTSDASMQPPPVAAKPREMAHEPISLSANPCPPASAGSRTAAVDQSNDRVARRSSMTILLKDDPRSGGVPETRWRRRATVRLELGMRAGKGCRMARLHGCRKADFTGMQLARDTWL